MFDHPAGAGDSPGLVLAFARWSAGSATSHRRSSSTPASNPGKTADPKPPATRSNAFLGNTCSHLTTDPPPPPTPPAAGPRPARGPVRVLIIDDNPSYADLLTCALDTIDDIHCVGTATSAAEGFARLTELDPTVVMMDLMMPGLDGLAATRQLRQLSPDTAVAVVSAHSDTEWIARAEDAGASAYIPKGGSLTELIDVLRAATPGPMIVTPSLHTTWPAERPTPQPDPTGTASPGTANTRTANTSTSTSTSTRRRSTLRAAATHLRHRIQTTGRTRQPRLYDL